MYADVEEVGRWRKEEDGGNGRRHGENRKGEGAGGRRGRRKGRGRRMQGGNSGTWLGTQLDHENVVSVFLTQLCLRCVTSLINSAL